MEIREATQSDLTSLCKIYNHYVEHTHVTFDLEPFTVEQRQPWFDQFNHDPKHRLFVVVVDSKVLGYASSSSFRAKPAYNQSVETTIYLSPDATGQGLGGRLYRHLLSSLEDSDIHRCYGIIALPNDASVQLHKSLGFREVGHLHEVGFKFSRYWDTLWLELELD